LNATTQLYDLAYRNYDATLGRFHQVDPLATKFASHTPYNFAFNNPVLLNDPMGDHPDWVQLDPIFYTPYDDGYGRSGGGWAQTMSDAYAVMGGSMSLGDYAAKYGTEITDKKAIQAIADQYNNQIVARYSIVAGENGTNYGWNIGVNRAGHVVLADQTPVKQGRDGIWRDSGKTTYMDFGGYYGMALSIPLSEDGPGFFSSFANGFMNGPMSNEVAPSSLAGGYGLMFEGLNAAVRNDARYVSKFSNLRSIATASKYVKAAGTGIALIGAGATLVEAALDGNLSVGDGAKLALAGVSLACPVFGVAYGLIDITVQFSTGTSLTDRIANGLDTALPNAKIGLGY